ncbi:MAG: aminotransferase class III-fold pyridoxal phosphate-dependent enzyme [Pseudomonadota bacterium]
MNTFETPVGPLSEPLSLHDRLMKITPRPAAVMARGAGSYLWDEAGCRYLDFIQGWAVNCLGHCPHEVAQAVTAQAQTLITPSPALHNRPQLDLAEQLVSVTGMAQVHFSNSGAEANEVAIKLARKWGRSQGAGRFRVISTHNGFHGRTLATMAASGKPGWDGLFPPYVEGFHKVPFGDLQAMADAIDGETVALMVEPIQGEAGVVVPPEGYLQGLRRLADQHNLLLILDEIQTGFGRTGTLCHFQQVHVTPDIITLGKGLGGGLPLSATLANERAAVFEFGDQGGTFNGNPLTTAVGAAVLNTVNQPEFLATVRQREAYLVAGLQGLQSVHQIVQVRGCGLLYALVLGAPLGAEVADYAFQQGLLLNSPRPDVLRLMPSLRVSEAEIDEFLNILDHCLAKLL